MELGGAAFRLTGLVGDAQPGDGRMVGFVEDHFRWSSMPDTSAANGEITTDTVKHLAGLSRIALTDGELDSLTRELDSILQNIAKVSEVAGAEVPPTSHPIPITNVARPDEVADVLTVEQALVNAPDTDQGMFRVSSILGEEQ